MSFINLSKNISWQLKNLIQQANIAINAKYRSNFRRYLIVINMLIRGFINAEITNPSGKDVGAFILIHKTFTNNLRVKNLKNENFPSVRGIFG